MSDPIPYENPESDSNHSEPRPHKKKRDAGDIFATIGTATILGGALAVILILFLWLIVWLINALPWS